MAIKIIRYFAIIPLGVGLLMLTLLQPPAVVQDLLVSLGNRPAMTGRQPMTAHSVTPMQPVPMGIISPPPLHFHQPGDGMPALPLDIGLMRAAGAVAAQALDLARTLVKVGTTTDAIDEAVHQFIISQGGYPSPLDYAGFPKSVCTSVNEVVVHGIPDQRPLHNGDIINVDITVYLGGVHADTSATFEVGVVSSEARALIAATRASLTAALAACRPGAPVTDIGKAVQRVADSEGYNTIQTMCGHGIGTEFHGKPSVPLFWPRSWDLSGRLRMHLSSAGKYVLEPGKAYTLEPIFVEGSPYLTTWEDKWTLVTRDKSLSAQFEMTVVVWADEAGGGGCDVVTPFLWEAEESISSGQADPSVVESVDSNSSIDPNGATDSSSHTEL